MVGTCFYHDTFPKGEHLFVVVAPSANEDWFICVNVTEKRELSDTTCELTGGCHPELTKPISVVNYAQARELPKALVERLNREQRLSPISQEILARIQQGGISADSRLKNKFKRAIQAHLQS